MRPDLDYSDILYDQPTKNSVVWSRFPNGLFWFMYYFKISLC